MLWILLFVRVVTVNLLYAAAWNRFRFNDFRRYQVSHGAVLAVGDRSLNSQLSPSIGVRIAIVQTQKYKAAVECISSGIKATLQEFRVADDDIFHTTVPSLLDIPMAAKLLVLSKRFDTIVCVGCDDFGRDPTLLTAIVMENLLRLSVDSCVHCVPAIASRTHNFYSITSTESSSGEPFQGISTSSLHQIGVDAATSAVLLGSARAQMLRPANLTTATDQQLQFVNFKLQ